MAAGYFDVPEVDGCDWSEDEDHETIDAGCSVPQLDEDDLWDDIALDDKLASLRRSSALYTGTCGQWGLATLGFSQNLAASCMSLAQHCGIIDGSCLTWERGEVLGVGSMGKVFKALDQRNGRIVAVKEVPLSASNMDAVTYRKQLETEIAICKELHHPNIVEYLGSDYIDENFYIYLEYMAGGSMAQVLEQFGALEECLLAPYARDVLVGLEHLHSLKPNPVVHRDIKAGNVLVGLDCRVKLADFGCSKMDQMTFTKGLKGSIPWMAPEIILGKGYGRKADVWSFGCFLIEMATGQQPWGKFDNPMAAMRKIGMTKDLPPFPRERLSRECVNFIDIVLNRDTTVRPKAVQLLGHIFIRNAPDADA